MTTKPPLIAAAAPLCVYYDGGCPLCRAEVATYQQAKGGDGLRWVDANGSPSIELGHDLDAATALARMHVRRADGTLVSGAAAFVEIWQILPAWRGLAKVARLPGVMPLLEWGYTVFLILRPLWRPASGWVSGYPTSLLRELRTDHAGETGAVMIYRGILALARTQDVKNFAQHHLDTESRHLQLLEETVPSRWRSSLLPLWRMSGWCTGAIPALFGSRAVYATIQAVETFVDKHYAAQVVMIDDLLSKAPPVYADTLSWSRTQENLQRLRALIVQCQSDEIAHREDARSRWDEQAPFILRVWIGLVSKGSQMAVGVCRYV